MAMADPAFFKNGWTPELEELAGGATITEIEDNYAPDEVEALIEEFEDKRYAIATQDEEDYLEKYGQWCVFCEDYGNHASHICPHVETKYEDITDIQYNALTQDEKDEVDAWFDKVDDALTEEHLEGDFYGLEDLRRDLEDEEDDWYEDENLNIIPYDPYETCYWRNDGLPVMCRCLLEKKVSCIVCDVGRAESSHAWRPHRDDCDYETMSKKRGRKKRQQQRSKNQNQKALPSGEHKASDAKKTLAVASKEDVKQFGSPSQGRWNQKSSFSSGYSYDGWDDDWGGYWGTDRHYGSTYTTFDESITFHVSSLWNNRKEDDYTPEWGLYFDWGWKPWWRAEHIDWPDYGLPEVWDIALEQLVVAVEKAQKGVDVEFGCIGGHGRTGTALAAVNVILGADPVESISHVRKNHCSHAIETQRQEWWVKWVHAQLNDLPDPPQPTYKSSGSTYTSPKSSGVVGSASKPSATSPFSFAENEAKKHGQCVQKEHFQYWLDMDDPSTNTTCPRLSGQCDWWKRDVENFLKGNYPIWGANTTTPTKPQLAVSTSCRGYLVPKPHRSQKSHAPGAKRSCKCDVCQYLELGHGAFLRPIDEMEGRQWDREMDVMERKAQVAMADRKRKLAADMPTLDAVTGKPEEWIKVAQADGSIMDVRIHPDFRQKPPKGVESPFQGERRADYVFVNGEGWIWEGLAKFPV